MAAWKRLTSTHAGKIDVNMDNVVYMEHDDNHKATTLYFVGGSNPVSVTETIDEIHQVSTVKD
jgi:hypothetical protein